MALLPPPARGALVYWAPRAHDAETTPGGPVAFGEFAREVFARGDVKADTLVWTEGLEGWTRLDDPKMALWYAMLAITSKKEGTRARPAKDEDALCTRTTGFHGGRTDSKLSLEQVRVWFARAGMPPPDAPRTSNAPPNSADMIKMWRTVCLDNRDVALGPALEHAEEAEANTHARDVVIRAAMYALRDDDEPEETPHPSVFTDATFFGQVLERALADEAASDRLHRLCVLGEKPDSAGNRTPPDSPAEFVAAIARQAWNCARHDRMFTTRLLELATAHEARAAAKQGLGAVVKAVHSLAGLPPPDREFGEGNGDDCADAAKAMRACMLDPNSQAPEAVRLFATASAFDGATATHALCEHGKAGALRAIMLAFADGDAAERRKLLLHRPLIPESRERPLHIAAQHGHADVLTTLLAGAGENGEDDDAAIRAALLHATCDTSDYAQGDWVAVVNSKSTKDDAPTTDRREIGRRHRSPLMLACLSGDAESVDAILDAARAVGNGPGTKRKRALGGQASSQANGLALVPRMLTQRDNHGCDALCLACDSVEGDGPHLDIVRRLLRAGALVVNAHPASRLTVENDDGDSDDDGALPSSVEPYASGVFHTAVRNGHAALAKLLLANEPHLANLRLRTSDGGSGPTPLLLAARKGNVPVVQALIDAGADVSAASADGKRAVDVARANGARCAQVARLLEEASL